MPQYALLIYGPPDGYEALDEDQSRAMYAAHERFGAMLAERGVVRGGAELAFGARSVRRREGRVVVTDGPYAEVPEVLGGFYLVEVADEDEATELARQVPALDGDVIEVRRLMQADELPA